MPMSASRRLKRWGAVALVLIATDAVASSEFLYFATPDLDFWKDAPAKETPAASTRGLPVPKPSAPPSTSGFQWNKYLDPKNDDFFREGEYTPPAPFMEIARDPSNSNIENWYRYLEMKNQLLHRLQEKLTAFAVAHQQSIPAMPAEVAAGAPEAPAVVTKAAARIAAATGPLPDAKRFRLRLYFDSHCPHCEHMISTTIRELASLGFWIELRQVDRDENTRKRIPFSISPASPDELKRYGIESVPLLLVGDLKARSFFKMQGDQTAGAVLAALNANSPHGNTAQAK